MENPISKKPEVLFPLAEKAAGGLNALQVTLGIMHNTEALVLAELATARAKNSAYQSAKSDRLDTSKAQTSADKNGKEFIQAARDSLKRKLGQRYSQAWDAVGFTNNSIAVPATIGGRKELLKSMELYFTKNPQHEVVSENITSVQAGVLHASHSTAVADVDSAKVDQRDAKKERDNAIAALQDRLRKLYHELGQFLDDNDPRWLKFGFNIPADNSLPEAPADLTVTGGAPGHLVPRWTPAARAALPRFQTGRGRGRGFRVRADGE